MWEKGLSETQSRKLGRRQRVKESEDNLTRFDRLIQEMMNT